jgi:hypothetical protein
VPGGLPEVSQAWTADVSDYIAAMSELIASTREAAAAVEELQHTIDELHGKTVNLGVDTAAANAAAAVNDLANAEFKANAAGQLQMETTRLLAESDEMLAGQEERLTQAYADQARSAALVIAANEALKDAYTETTAGQRLQAETAAMLAESEAMEASSVDLVTEAYGRQARDAALLIAANKAINLTTVDAATGEVTAAAATDVLGRAATRAYRPWWAFGNNFLTVAHWVVAGSAEFLAVAVPAAVALGAGLLVAMQGAQNAGAHFQALYDTTESLHAATGVTVGTVLGLGHALQTAQDAANPGVYEVLGSVLNDAKQGFTSLAGVGLQVVHMFDEFAARVTVDLKSGMGTQIQGLLSGMVRDLQQFGQILGNLGHALLNFASAMPGLARFLLAVADGISRVILAVSGAGALITFGMALEEMYRWGGLVLGILARIGVALGGVEAAAATGFISKFGAALQAVVVDGGMFISWIGRGLAALGEFSPELGAAGEALKGFGQGIQQIAEMSPLMVAGWAAAGFALAALVVGLSRVKDATQQWITTTNQAIQTASAMNVIGDIANAFAQTTTRITAQQTALQSYSGAWQAVGKGVSDGISFLQALHNPLGSAAQGLETLSTKTSTLGSVVRSVLAPIPILNALFGHQAAGAELAASNIARLQAEQTVLASTTRTVGSNIGFLAGAFHTSAVGAIALASAAGVNLTQGLLKGTAAGQIAIQMINNLKAGLGLMQAPAGAVGREMEAIGVQSQLAATKVQQANQAIDQFVASAVSGTSTWAAFRISLQGVSQGALKLSGDSITAAQNWQKFDGAVTSGNAMLDTLRTGMAEGVVSFHSYSGAVKDTVAMLLQFGGHNATAVKEASTLAQMIGGPDTSSFKTLANWAGITGQKAGPQLAAAMRQASAAMSNLDQIAKNLSVVVGSQLDSAMASAITKASQVGPAFQKWANDMASGHASRAQLAGDVNTINGRLSEQAKMTEQATSVLNKGTSGLKGYGDAAKAAGNDVKQNTTDATANAGEISRLSSEFSRASGPIKATGDAARNTGTQFHATSGTTQELSGRMRDAGTAMQGTQGHAVSLAGQVRNAGTAAQAARAAYGTFNNELRNTVGAADGARGAVSSASGAIRTLGSSASAAAGQVRSLAAALASIHSVSATVSISQVTTTSTVKAQHGGIIPGYMPGRDIVPAMLSPGEGILNPYAVKMLGAGFVHWANMTAERGGGGGTVNPAALRAGVSGPGGGGTAVIHNHIILDGREIATSVRRQDYAWSTRNSGVRSGLNIPGTRVG